MLFTQFLPPRRPKALSLPALGLLAAVVCAFIHLGLHFSLEGSDVSPVWPVAGVALAALLWLGPGAWSGIGLGAFVAHAMDLGRTPGVTLVSALGLSTLLALGATLEALLGWWLWQRWLSPQRRPSPQDPLGSEVRVFRFAALALAMGLVSAFIGLSAMCALGDEAWPRFWPLGLVWWFGHASGVLLVTPFLLVWATAPRSNQPPRISREGLLSVALLGLCAWSVFGERASRNAFPYLALAPLVWMSVRLELRALTSGLLLLAAGAIWQTLHKVGPEDYAAAVHLWVFLWVAALTSLWVAGMVMGLKKSEARLLSRNEEVEERARTLQIAQEELEAENLRQAQAAEAARDAFERHQLVLAHFPEGSVALFDEDLRLLLVDGASLKSGGFSKEFLEGKPIAETLPAETVQVLEPRFRAALAGREEHFEMPSPGRAVHVHTLPVRDAQGRIVAGMSLCRDISAQKRSEEALRKERDFNAAILHTVPALILVLDREGRIVEFNRACQETSGYSLEDVQGKVAWELALLTPEEIAGIQGDFARVLAGAPPQQTERFWIAKDGARRLMTWSYALLPFSDGPVQYVIGTGTDITEQRDGEERRRLAAIVETSEDAIFSKDQRALITSWNGGAEHLFGYTAADIIGQPVSVLDAPGASNRAKEFLGWLSEGGHVEQYDVRHRCKDGRLIDVSVRVSPIFDKEGRFVGCSSICRDISARVRAEEALKQALKKEILLQREIHHRVKNNLQLIISLFYLQSARVREPRILEILLESQERIRSIAITHELLSRSEDLTRIDLGEYARQVTAHLLSAYRVDSETIAVAIDSENLLLPIDLALPCGLILTELLSNALKYAFPGGRHGRVSIVFPPAQNGLVSFSISDNGIGLPEGFDAAKATTLGWMLVGDLARQLSGHLEIQREAGTRVTLTFPLPAAAA